MALKEKWVDKRDNVDDVLAEDINDIAHAVIDLEDHTNSVLKFTSMSLTDEQKAVSRENIGAASVIEATASGDSITLTDSADGFALRGLNLYGKSVQDTTTGAQLASFPDVDAVELGGLTWSCKGGVITVSGTQTGTSNSDDVGIVAEIPVAAGTYSVSGDVGLVGVRVEVTHADGSVMVYYSTDTITLDGTETSVRVYCKAYATATIDYTLYPMLNAGTSAKAWEPYTGGMAAPNPDYPRAISSPGDGGAVAVSVNDQTFTVSTPNGLAGVPVTSGGNYTDEGGQRWVCDEIDFARGVYVQRIKRGVVSLVGVGTLTNGYKYSVFNTIDKVYAAKTGAIAEKAVYIGAYNAVLVKPGTLYENVTNFVFVGDTTDTTETLQAKYNGSAVYYILAEPVETPLTEEQLAAYAALRTTKPTTLITNDGGAGMAVTYAADTKAYIDKKFNELAAALVSNK